MGTPIQIFADGRYFPVTISKGCIVSFSYLPNGKATRAGHEKRVPYAILNQDSGRVITATYQEMVGLFHKHIKTYTCPVLRRLPGRQSGMETYRIDDYIAQLDFKG